VLFSNLLLQFPHSREKTEKTFLPGENKIRLQFPHSREKTEDLITSLIAKSFFNSLIVGKKHFCLEWSFEEIIASIPS